MKNREIGDYLEDILVAIREVLYFTKDLTYEDFSADRKTINAVIRSLEVMGEAAKKIPQEMRADHPKFRGKGWRRCATRSSMNISASI